MKKITTKKAVKRLADSNPRGFDLVYIDYRDSLDENGKALTAIVSTGYYDEFFQDDGSHESMEYFLKEEFADVELSDETREALHEYMREHDTSDPLSDLVRNTRAQWFYYPLGIDVASDAGEKGKKEIMEYLKLDAKHGKAIDELVDNAWDGGALCLLFHTDIDNFHGDPSKDPKRATLKAELCIMDRMGGSGHSVEMPVIWDVPFDRSRFRLDEHAPGCSFAVRVCGLSSEYYDTGLSIKKTGEVVTFDISEPFTPSVEEVQEKEDQARWDKVKKCRAGDMKMSRHGEITYSNNFPCGTKCTACGTFWID